MKHKKSFVPKSTDFLENRALPPKELLGNVLSTARAGSPIQYWMALLIFVLGLAFILGLFIDDRTLMGINVWLKPLKFSISIGIYLLTVGYFITKYPYSERKKNIINHVVAWTLLVELVIIAFQAFRGISSHYNVETEFDGMLFSLMGLLIGINVLIMALFIIDTIRLKLRTTKSVQWAILLGWLMIFFGSWVGGQMIGQMAHSVGVADGGTGLPLVNWSTIGGDLRVAHFFALHGLQIIPIFAFGISLKGTIPVRSQVLAVTCFGLLYAFWIGVIFYQAQRGIPWIAS